MDVGSGVCVNGLVLGALGLGCVFDGEMFESSRIDCGSRFGNIEDCGSMSFRSGVGIGRINIGGLCAVGLGVGVGAIKVGGRLDSGIVVGTFVIGFGFGCVLDGAMNEGG